jgi:hypothetical protein
MPQRRTRSEPPIYNCILSFPVDGGWGSWKAWDTQYCADFGFKMRERKCDKPKPKDGGAQCFATINFLEVEMC